MILKEVLKVEMEFDKLDEMEQYKDIYFKKGYEIVDHGNINGVWCFKAEKWN